MRRGLLLFLSLCLLLTTACTGRSKQPATPAPAQKVEPSAQSDPGQRGAMAALKAYAEARQALDIVRAYEALTPSARAAFKPEEFIAALKDVQGYTYASLVVETPKDGLVRGYALDLVMTGSRPLKYARYAYTLRYEDGRWGLALGTGLRVRALKAFETGKFDEDLKITDEWLALDPYAWEAYVERFYVYKDTGRPDEAKRAMAKALELAAPEDQPELHATLANLYLLSKQGDQLLETARLALDGAAKLGKEQADRYSVAWRATQTAQMAFAYRYKGDQKQALKYYQEAKALDPTNAAVERFERTLLAG